MTGEHGNSQQYYCNHCLKDFGSGHHCCDCNLEAQRLPAPPRLVQAKCINLKCRTYTWDNDDVTDWIDTKGRMRFYIDQENEDSYSGVLDVHPIIDTNSYEYVNRHLICSSLCNSGASFDSLTDLILTTQTQQQAQ